MDRYKKIGLFKILFILFIVEILAISFFLLSKLNGNKENTNVVPKNEVNEQSKVQVTEAIIKVTESGFEPLNVKIEKETNVVWKNESGKTVSVNSDSHPTHLLYPPLNLGSFNNNSSVQLIFKKSGKYKYHNHLNPKQTGIIVVE